MFFAISAFYMLVKAEADLWKIMFLIDASFQFHANMHILLSSETKYGCNTHTANLYMLTGKQMESIKGQKWKKKKNGSEAALLLWPMKGLFPPAYLLLEKV